MNNEIKEKADKILYDFGLLDKLDQYGKTHIIGSYLMNLMAWNDLDIDVENEEVNIKNIHEIIKFVIDKFTPVWIEGKRSIMNGKKCYFIGFETEVLKELWNVDIWFFDKMEIENCEKYCNEINKKTDKEKQKTIIGIKRELINAGIYNTQYGSVDIYDAVLNHNIKNVHELLKNYKKTKIEKSYEK
jgi:hypothetical protein